MSSTYMVLIPTDETAWDAAPIAQHERVFAQHEKFQAALAERGMRVVATSALEHSREGRVIRSVDGTVTVTDGPYAESAEQLSGFYLVEADDYDVLCDVVAVLASVETRLEIRPTAGGGPS